MGGYLRRVGGFGRDIKLFLLYNLLANVGFGVFLVIFNLYLTALGRREDYIGILSATQTLTMAATASAFGLLLGRFGTWRCITGGFGLFLASSFGLALVEHPTLLLVLAALNGAGLAFLFTATMPFIIEWARPDQRQEVAALSFSLISLASTLGALVGGFAPALISGPIPAVEPGSVGAYRWALVAGTVIATFGLAPLFLMGAARREKPPADPAVATASDDVAGRRQVRRDMGVFILVGGVMSLGFGMVLPFYNVFLASLGASARQIGYVYALGGLTAALIGLAAPVVARRLGAIPAILMIRLAIVPVFALLIAVPSLWLAVLAHLVRQTSISMSWPIDSTFTAEVLPPRARANVFGLRSAAWNLGFAVASLVAGGLIVRYGYDVTFLSMILFTALSMGIFAAYFGRHPLVRSGQVSSASPSGRSAEPAAPAAEPIAPASAPEPQPQARPGTTG